MHDRFKTMRGLLIRSLVATLSFGLGTTNAQSNYEPYSITTVAGESARALFNQPLSVAVDKNGNIFVADTLNHAIRKITPDSFVTTFAGLPGSAGSTDGVGSAARFNGPQSIAIDGAGNVYVADTGNHTIRQITPGGA